MEAPRLAALKSKLASLRYQQPLGLESAPLVESLLDDLVRSQQKQAELAAIAESRADEISLAEQHVLPVRKENTRLMRENNDLHMQIIADAEAAEAARLELETAAARLRDQNTDLRFITTQQGTQLEQLRSESVTLRSRLQEALIQNGVVLASGHEVRWHGQMERMTLHSPAATAESDAATAAAGGEVATPAPGGSGQGAEAELAAAARQVRASARQTSHLQMRLQEAEARATEFEELLSSARAAAEKRDEELRRLQAVSTSGQDATQLSVAHVNEEKNLTIAQLNHQVDFLNSQCTVQEEELASTRQAARQAAELEAKAERLIDAVHQLREEKGELTNELLAAQKMNEQLRALGLDSSVTTAQTAQTGSGKQGGATGVSRVGGGMATGGGGGHGGDGQGGDGTGGRLVDAASEGGEHSLEVLAMRNRLDEALSALAREKAARAKLEAMDVSAVYEAYQADRASLAQAVELLQQEKATLSQRLETVMQRAEAAEAAVRAGEGARKEMEVQLRSASQDAHTFAESAAVARAERDALESQSTGPSTLGPPPQPPLPPPCPYAHEHGHGTCTYACARACPRTHIRRPPFLHRRRPGC